MTKKNDDLGPGVKPQDDKEERLDCHAIARNDKEKNSFPSLKNPPSGGFILIKKLSTFVIPAPFLSPLRRQGLGLRSVSKANQIIKPNVVPVPAFDRRDKGKTRENVRNK